MRIAIIGTGNVGGALARNLKTSAHELVLGARDPESDAAKTLAHETGAQAVKPDHAAAGADIVILALPWSAMETATKALGDLSGKIVIDCTNPLGMIDGALGLVLGHDTSGGELVTGWLQGARVVKTLNQVGAEVMARNDHMPHRPVMFMAGDDDEAKRDVAGLLSELGFDPLDAGDLTKSRLLEPFAMVWINQALFRGFGRDWAFAAVKGD